MKNYTDEELIEAIKTSNSKCATLKKLGLQPYGGNYNVLDKNIKRLNIDISHFSKEIWNKGKRAGPKRSIESYLNNQFPIGSSALRNRLIKEGLKTAKCEECNLTEWKGKPLRLELDHIDSNHFNNDINNLRILCPNCHSQTPGHRKQKTIKPKRQYHCECGKLKDRQSIKCVKCAIIQYQKNTKIEWPSKEELAILVWEKPRSILAKELGVSDTIIAKHCKKLEIAMPSRGYWQKLQANK